MRALRFGLVACFSAEILGCGSDLFTWSDKYFDPGCPNPDITRDTPCEGEGALCAGGCIPPQLNTWEGPSPVWMGAPADAPECPAGPNGQPITAWEGYAGRNPPIECGACSCGPSTGSCRLPTAFTAHATPQCPAPPGTAESSFNAPYMWNGSCTDANPILLNATCPPGNTLCVQSLSIAPVAIDADAKCTPAVETPALITQADLWETLAVACFGYERDTCPGGYFCSNTAAVNGWRQCAWRRGLYQCDDNSPKGAGGNESGPGGDAGAGGSNGTGMGGAAGAGGAADKPPTSYTERFVFYEVSEDKRACTPCECGTPQGDSCLSQISLYSTVGCSGVPIWGGPVASDPGFCQIVQPAGTALMSKEATEPTYTPGTCTPFGGNPIGSVVGSAPVTVCCLPLL